MSSKVLKNKNVQITQHYGNGHTGVDVVGQGGTVDMVVAHSSGKIVFCQKGQKNNKGSKGNASYGNCVKIKHDNGMYTLYAHLADVRVNLGQYVKQGQDLGQMGNTGNSYGTHLHFEVFNKNNIRVNPEKYLNISFGGNINYTGTITYQVYNGKWEKEVNKADNTPNGYAGDKINFVSGVRAKPRYGEIKIKSHVVNKEWLNEVSSNDYVANDIQSGKTYSGIYGQPIDAIMFTTTKGYVNARVLTKRGWLPWVKFYNKFDEKIYVGNFGEPILGLQMK